ncbi:hypothetical protein CROQUDRAFT_668839 [Cronartium quercuum f. sp. fusiforme G11]|uniref:Aldehyde dehydrogenase domain-containing protein n=1 Tax=Cronartium quercuum f. sp. fusiforme G11 TaxID=708437 RepID=A0A9P6NTG3_9BASI|nr:hypothetical protein CROQUDRAFT_668839 [Cronartium quercuum f. sp. fusiforme G11]
MSSSSSNRNSHFPGLFINGQLLNGSGQPMSIEDPATGTMLKTISTGSVSDVTTALRLAENTHASGSWSRLHPIKRSEVLAKISHGLRAQLEDLSRLESLQTGRPIREMKTQLTRLPEWFDYFAALARTQEDTLPSTQGQLLNYVRRIPLGVVAQITPFNHPLLIAVKKLAPALATGNTVIIKPSEFAPLSILKLAQICKEAGLPDGVLSVLSGPGHITGKALVDSPIIKKIDFTGSTEVGRKLGATAGQNLASITSELGGKAPVVVMNDANLEVSVNGVCFASFIASGQTCVAGTRILVEEGIYDKFLDRLQTKISSIEKHIGSPLNPKSTMGPLIHMKQLDRVQSMVTEAQNQGCELITGGYRMVDKSLLDGTDLSLGYFYSPTVLVCPSSGLPTLWEQEAFGPVLLIKRFSGEDEMVRLCNQTTPFGLGSGMFSSNISKCIRVAERLEAGICWINTWHRNDPSSPWGGMKDSGIGRENGIEAWTSYTQTKSVILNYASEESQRLDDWFNDDDASDIRYG